jgi:RimJ/RimL family protein N-acetyltransferase
MLSQLDAWLEGIRIDPNYRSQGIATALTLAALAEAMRRGATHVRLATAATNTATAAMMERLHMRQVGGFVPFTAQPLTSPPHHNYHLETTQRATPDDFDEIIGYLNLSNIFPAFGGLYYIGFIGYVITTKLLQEKIAAQQIYLLRRWERIDGLAIAEVQQGQHGKHLSLGYIDGTTIEAISLIAYDLRCRLSSMGLERIFVYAPDLVLVRDSLAGIEYERNGEIHVTYERKLT